MTGQGAALITRDETLPISSRMTGPKPREPSTRRSIPTSAASRSFATGSPRSSTGGPTAPMAAGPRRRGGGTGSPVPPRLRSGPLRRRPSAESGPALRSPSSHRRTCLPAWRPPQARPGIPPSRRRRRRRHAAGPESGPPARIPWARSPGDSGRPGAGVPRRSPAKRIRSARVGRAEDDQSASPLSASAWKVSAGDPFSTWTIFSSPPSFSATRLGEDARVLPPLVLLVADHDLRIEG